jgi:hypothetical protein
MKLKFLCIVTLVTFSIWFTGCSEDPEENEKTGQTVTPPDETGKEEEEEEEEETPETGLSSDEQQQIAAACREITETVTAALSEATETDFEQLAEDLKSHPLVENAWIEGQTLTVKFRKGGIIRWQIRPGDMIIPPYQGDITSTRSGLAARASAAPNLPGNNRACLINQQFGDEGRGYCRDVVNYLSGQLEQNDYEVTVRNGEEADVDFFREELSRYGVIFCISHGSYDSVNDLAWIVTGEEASTLERLFADWYTWWTDNRVSVGYVCESRNGTWTSVAFYMVSSRLIASEYASKPFPNSLTYWVACQSMKSPALGQALQASGAGVTVGWDETNCLGQSTGMLLFQALLGGADMDDAFLALPSEAKNDPCSIADGASLVYYPAGGGNMALVAAASPTAVGVVLDSPVSDSLYVDRVLQLSGHGSGFKTVTRGTVEVNGIATNLTLTGDTAFSQPVEIREGENRIRVTCYGVLANGKSTYASIETTVTGNFPVLALYTQLRWNTNLTDVDFYLLPPGSSISELFTDKACAYYNRSPEWGAFLDVDDTNGYGPEHITIPAVSTPGVYTLYVQYYGDREQGISSDAFVNVAANNGSIVNFGPFRLNRGRAWRIEGEGENETWWLTREGDVWEVCTIEYPGGKITPVNRYHDLNTGTRSAAGVMMTKK